MKSEHNEYSEEKEIGGAGRGLLRRGGRVLITAASFLVLILILYFILENTGERSSGLVINEVVSKNSGSADVPSLGTPDWIELYNSTAADIDISGYKLTNNKDSYEFENKLIKAGEYLLVYAAGNISETDGLYCASFGISNSGDAICLIDKNGTLIDRLGIPALSSDESYARRSDGTFGFSIGATPGEKNNDNNIMDEENIQALIDSSNVTVSEVFPGGADGESWVELYNAGSVTADLGCFCLTDSKGDPSKWHIPETKLEAGKYAVIYMSGGDEDSLHAPFRFGSSDNGIYLYDITGAFRSSIQWQSGMSGGVSVVADNKYTLSPTKGAANSEDTFSSAAQTAMDLTDPVRINEVLTKNKYGLADSNGNRYGWVELYNGGSAAVPLKGYYLSDDGGDLFKWAFPDSEITAGGYITVFLTGETDKQKELRASFRLSEGEKKVFLTSVKGMRVDTFALPEKETQDVSVGRDVSGSSVYYITSTPGSVNSEGLSNPPESVYPNKKGVYISEVSAAAEAKKGKNDWIELHNGSGQEVNLEGYYISDDTANTKKWKIGTMSVSAGGYAVIEASSGASGSKIADFGISPSGETLVLSDPNGSVIDVFETGVLSAGITSGRLENGDSLNRVYFTSPTRGAANSADYKTGYTDMPRFSDTSLYHSEVFKLSISSSTPKAKIYYTTDGSVPTLKSKLYTAPIEIGHNTPVRAMACAEGLLQSEIRTETYIFDSPHTLPVFCINGKPSEIKKILSVSNFRHKPEYAAYVEYYEADGTLGVSFASGVRPKGRASLENPQKSLTMSLKSDYGQKNVTYPFFAGSSITTYTTLTLRNSGQDAAVARMRDSYFQKLSKGLNLDTVDTKLVVAYINGKYYGLFDLNEEQNSDYAASHFGVDSNKVDMIDRNGSVIKGKSSEFKRILIMAKTLNTASDKNFAEFSKYVDADACIDYLIARIYFGDGDVINQRFWRAQDYSVKWRPLLFDLDWSFRFNDASRNKFSRYFSSSSRAGNGSMTDMHIFLALKKNKGWRDKFVERFVQLAETQFSSKNMLSVFDETVDAMRPEMAKHIARFHTPRSMSAWNSQISKFRDAIKRRQSIALVQLQRYFRVSNQKMKELKDKYSQ